MYVEDAAESILLAAARYDDSEPVNLGTSQEIGIRDLMETIVQMTKYDGKVLWDVDRPNGQPRRKLDVTRTQEKFGFTSMTPFVEGLRKTVDWYAHHIGTSA